MSLSGSDSDLTPELQERIRKNRENALKIQAERKRKLEEKQRQADSASTSASAFEHTKKPRTKEDSGCGERSKPRKEVEDCEEWEWGLPELITKKEAVTMYCVPEGTLAVCQVAAKDNPRHKGWAPMKLYRRTEVRERAYERHGGKERLIEERSKRQKRKLAKELCGADQIFAPR